MISDWLFWKPDLGNWSRNANPTPYIEITAQYGGFTLMNCNNYYNDQNFRIYNKD